MNMYLKLRSTDSTKEPSVNRLNGSWEALAFLTHEFQNLVYRLFVNGAAWSPTTMSRR